MADDKDDNKESSPDATQSRTPSLTLPKGDGAIKGIGETFQPNPFTGNGSLSVPIATSPGRSGFGPLLSLSYDSGAASNPTNLLDSSELAAERSRRCYLKS